MKKIIHPRSIPVFVMLASVPALALRLWTIGKGPDDAGLYAPKPLAWTLLVLLSLAVAGTIVYAVRNLKTTGSYQKNFPRSLIAGVCILPAAVCFIVYSCQQLRETAAARAGQTTALDTIVGIAGLIAGICLILVAIHRILGRRPYFALHALICLYLAVLLFNRCQKWDNTPQINDMVFPLFATVSLMLAVYQKACFDVDLGNRRNCLLWSLMSVYLCLVAMLSYEQVLFYGACAIWMICDLCSTRPLNPKARPAAQTPERSEDLPEETP